MVNNMKFKSYVGKSVMTQNGVITFIGEVIETSDDTVILALKNALDVEELTEKPEKVFAEKKQTIAP